MSLEDQEIYGDAEYLWEVSGFATDGEWTWYVSSNSVFEAMKEAFRNKPWHSDKGIKVRMIPNYSSPKPNQIPNINERGRE